MEAHGRKKSKPSPPPLRKQSRNSPLSLSFSLSLSLSLSTPTKKTQQKTPQPHLFQQDCKSPDVKLSNDADNKHGHLVFKGKGEGADPEAHDYGLDLDFFGAIDVEASKVATNDRGVVLIVSKANKDAEEHWPRLLKAAGKAPSNIVSWELLFFRNDLRVFVLSTFLSHSFFLFSLSFSRNKKCFS